MKKIIIVVAVLFFIAHQCDKGLGSSSNETENKHCKRCSIDLTKDVNRIYNNDGYYCTPCWKTTQREIKQELKYQGY